MKIAILHSAIIEGNNGAEQYVYEMAKEWNSTIYTCDYNKRVESSLPGIKKIVKVQKIKHPDSFTKRYYEYMDVMAKRTDIDADFLIYSGSPPCWRVKKDPAPYLHLCYTPERGFYDLHDMVMGQMKEWGFPKFQIAKYYYHRRRKMDQDLFRNDINHKQTTTISNIVSKRYKKVYGKMPRAVVDAPVRTDKFKCRSSENFYFSAGGLRPNKRIDWQIKAIAKTKEKLVIAGDGQIRKDLEKLAKEQKANVEFLGRVSDGELIDNYSRCKAFIFSAIEEDFGLVPVEALASGKPVLCVSEGTPTEFIDDKVGYFFKDVKGLTKLIKSHTTEDYATMQENCIERAKRFDTKTVAEKIMKEIKGIKKEFY
jgi:glycosyltransferase involved in cell wall biosynthesis